MPDGSQGSLSEQDVFHRRLAGFNEHRFAPGLPHAAWEAEIDTQAQLLIEEGRWIEAFRATVAERAAEAPRTPDGFIAWFEALEHNGPGQNDPLFPWLAEEATMEEMRWFLTQEVAGRGRV